MNTKRIWIDGDAAPKACKEIIFKAANKNCVTTTLVANQYIQTPKSKFIKFVQVAKGLDVADSYIADNLEEGDLVITADIPLAAEVVKKNATALNPRGEYYTNDNISAALATRNLMDSLRSSGMVSGGPSGISNQDIQKFANALDRYIHKK